MSNIRRTVRETPACYATVHPGLEPVAADEITRDLGGEVKKAEKGVVVFRVKEVGPELLKLRTVEDVFLLAWGTDSLTYKADDLKQIERWTSHGIIASRIRKTTMPKIMLNINVALYNATSAMPIRRPFRIAMGSPW